MGGNDPDNFTIVLVNDQMEYKQVLNALVDGSLLTVFVNPPANGWPFGPGFHVDFASDTENLDNVLTKSDDFSIKEPSATTTATTSSGSSTALTTTSTSTTVSESTSYSYTPTTTHVAPTVMSSTTSSTASVHPTSSSAASAVSKSAVLTVLAAFVAIVL